MAASSDPKLYFMQKLKEFGKKKVKEMIPEGDTCNQYIVACIASTEEIENRNNKIIEEAETGSLEETYYFSKHLVVILNTQHWHGEARLLDPTGKLWKLVTKDKINVRAPFQGRYFLGEMKEKFHAEVMGAPKIWLFSHYIPCTIDRHQCARLLKEYVKASGDTITLSYEQTYYETNEEEAYNILLSEKNIIIIQPWKQQEEYIDEEDTMYYTERMKRRERNICKWEQLYGAQNKTSRSRERPKTRYRKCCFNPTNSSKFQKPL